MSDLPERNKNIIGNYSYTPPATASTGAVPRELPHSLEAEQALLGELLINNDGLDRITDFLKAEHFILPFHRNLYELINRKVNINQVATPLTIKEFLDKENNIGSLSAYEYTVQLTVEAVTVRNALGYATMIYRLFLRRSLIDIGGEIVTTAFDAPLELSPYDQIELAEQSLFNLAEKGQANTGFSPFKTALKQSIELAHSAYKRPSKLSGFPTYMTTLDNALGGLQSSDLIILAGRPGMGKTSLATNIAFNIANHYKAKQNEDGKEEQEQEGGVVGFFSLEMSAEQLATRIISEQAEISAHKIRRGDIIESDFANLSRLAHKLESLPLYIDETGGASIAQIASRARRLKRQYGLDVLVIDYIQLIQGSKKASTNRVNEITEITIALKALAKELNVPIIALSQLSRQVEHRDSKRPQLSDLRESGSIEQDADIVLFVYRAYYYKVQEQPALDTPAHSIWQEEMELLRRKAEIIIAKQRHGSTGSVELAFEAEFTRFYDLATPNHLPTQNY